MAIAAAVVSIVIYLLLTTALSPKQSIFPASSDTRLLLAGLLLTLAFAAWNVLGWWGARERVRFTSLYWFLGVAAFFLVLCAFAGVVYLYSWSAGAKVSPAWVDAARWGAAASCLLPMLALVRVAIRTGFIYDRFNAAISEQGIPWPRRAWWFAYFLGTGLSLLSSLIVLTNLTPQSLPRPELTTAAFAAPYVLSWISLIASVPVNREARRREAVPTTGP